MLFFSTVEFLRFERQGGEEMALGIPTWVAMLAMPVAFALITLRLGWKAGVGFRVADLVRDADLLPEVAILADELIAESPARAEATE